MQGNKIVSSIVPPKPVPKPGQVKVVRALYTYTARQPDELSFQEGDIMYVYDQISDPNWWKARCGSKSGLIPSNYVQGQVEEVLTPVHEAARRGNILFLRTLLENGVSGTGLDSTCCTPLYWACHAGHIDCVQELLNLSNSAVNAQNNIGDTPLHAAVSKGHLKIVEMLLDNGANPKLTNKFNESALDLANNSAILNLLQKSSKADNGRSSVCYDGEEYVDESD